jgi:beta-glucosidase-like glycosyl hydrolase
MFPRVLRETFLHPFKEAIQKAGAISVMASYNEIDGVPSHASEWLLRDVLRKEWGFKGICGFGLLRDLGIGPPARTRTAICGQG